MRSHHYKQVDTHRDESRLRDPKVKKNQIKKKKKNESQARQDLYGRRSATFDVNCAGGSTLCGV